MPNHVHVVLTPFPNRTGSEILHSWKSYTATTINRLTGRTGQLWQTESFDHVVRNEEALARFIEYVEQNPVVAGLCRRAEDWPFSSARFRGQEL
jgi:REP element-mobilizing transposase RayT